MVTGAGRPEGLGQMVCLQSLLLTTASPGPSVGFRLRLAKSAATATGSVFQMETAQRRGRGRSVSGAPGTGASWRFSVSHAGAGPSVPVAPPHAGDAPSCWRGPYRVCGARSSERGQGLALRTELVPTDQQCPRCGLWTTCVRTARSVRTTESRAPAQPRGMGATGDGLRICIATAPLPLQEREPDQPHPPRKRGTGRPPSAPACRGRRGAVIPSERGSVHSRDASVRMGLRGSPRPAAPDLKGCKAPFESYGSVMQRNARSYSHRANHSHGPV